jgi:hypothetical protein
MWQPTTMNINIPSSPLGIRDDRDILQWDIRKKGQRTEFKGCNFRTHPNVQGALHHFQGRFLLMMMMMTMSVFSGYMVDCFAQISDLFVS